MTYVSNIFRPSGSVSTDPVFVPANTASEIETHDSKATMINRDLSLIEFYWRVTEEARDQTQPLLERVKFLSIAASLIDEFYMIRVAGLKAKAGTIMELSPDGLTADQQLKAARERLLEMVGIQNSIFREDLIPNLQNEGIILTSFNSLSGDQRLSLANYFQENIYPVITP